MKTRLVHASGGVHRWVLVLGLVFGILLVLGVVASLAMAPRAKSSDLLAEARSIESTPQPAAFQGKDILLAAGVGGQQSMEDVLVWSEKQMPANFSHVARKKIHIAASLWQRELIDKMELQPALALLYSYQYVLEQRDESGGICSPASPEGVTVIRDNNEQVSYRINPVCEKLPSETNHHLHACWLN